MRAVPTPPKGRLLVLLLAGLLLAAPPARAQTVKYLNQLSGAAAVAGTNTLPLCQTAGGCGAGNALVNATVAQLNTYIQGQATATNRITTGTSNTLSSLSAPFTTELWVSATGGAKTDTVPGCASGLNGDYLLEVDGEGNAAANPITVTAASGTIGPAGTPAPSASYEIYANGGAALFQCDGAATHWALVGSAGNPQNVNYQTGTSYTIAATDNGGVIDQKNAGAIADTLPQAGTAGFPENAFVTLVHASGAGAVTVTPTTSTINGAASATVASGNSLFIFADGAGNYEGVPIQGPLPNSGVTAGSYTSTNLTVNAQGIVTAASNGAGGSALATYQASSWYWPFVGMGEGTATSYTASTAYCTPGLFFGPVTVEALGVGVGTVGSGADLNLAIYGTGTNGLPNGNPIATTGDIASSPVGAVTSTFTGSATPSLSAGEYFFCAQVADTTVKLTPVSVNSGDSIPPLIGGAAGYFIGGAGTLEGYYVSVTSFGTWPNFNTSTSWSSNNGPGAPAMVVEVKSSP